VNLWRDAATNEGRLGIAPDLPIAKADRSSYQNVATNARRR
jgi:hypothetical protein